MTETTETPDGRDGSNTAGRAEESSLYPLSSRTLELLFYTLVLAWIVHLLVLAVDFNWENKLFPFMLGSLTILFILIKLVRIVRPDLLERFTPDDEDSSDELKEEMYERDEDTRPLRTQEKQELFAILWVLALPVLLYFLGFTVGVAAFIFAFILAYERNLLLATVLAVVFPVVMYFLFVEILEMLPLEGALGFEDPLRWVFETLLVLSP